MLCSLGIEVAIEAEPYDTPGAPPFAEDTEHSSYDREAVERFWQALRWIDATRAEFGGWFSGKTSPVHFFWHSFDLALTRFSGRPAPELPTADPVAREAYSHEVISFGFWAGDQTVREPAFYSYTAPEPAGLSETPLRPEAARWQAAGSSHLAFLAYDEGTKRTGPTRDAARVSPERVRGGRLHGGLGSERLLLHWSPSESR